MSTNTPGAGPSLRRAIITSVVRGGVISALVILASLTVDGARGLGAKIWILVLIFLVLWTAIITVFLVWSVRAIRRSDYANVRALETLFVVAVMVVAVFAKAYLLISVADPSAFSEPLDSFTAYYFAMTVLATVGFGDITPVVTSARAVAMVQMGLDLVLLASLVRLVGWAVKSRHVRQDGIEVR